MTKYPTVLIVEDDLWLAEQYARSLNAVHIHTIVVDNALAAMDSLDSEVLPNALLMDVLLPGPNVFTLLHELRSHTDLATIPVILCTNNAESLAREDLSAYGVKQVIDKATMKPNDIVAAIKKVLL